MFKDLKQTVTNGLMAVRPPPVEEETDAKFLAHKAKLEELQQQLTATSLQVTAHVFGWFNGALMLLLCIINVVVTEAHDG
jgi:hypothetical protein